MYQSMHVVIQKDDEILPMGAAPSVTPGVQLYNSNLVGGPLTLSFGSLDNPAEGIKVAEDFEKVLRLAIDELYRRIGRPQVRPRPVLVPHGAAGDPAGEGSDFPVGD